MQVMTSSESSISWKKSLYAIFAAQLLVMAGFSFVFPFMPLYIEKIGHFSSQQAAVWAGIAEGSAGVAMFFAAPFWGILADRVGRKPMVLRAMVGGTIAILLIGLIPNVPFLIAMRFFQGMFSGVMAAASALVASISPRDKTPYAMGLMMTANFVGGSVGPLLGGLSADHFGYRTTFFIAASCLATGGVLVFILVKERFVPPAKTERASIGSMLRLAGSKQILTLLAIQFSLQAGPSMVAPIVPLFMEQLNPLGQAATAAGIALTIAGVAAAGSSIVAGRIAKGVPLKTILIVSCLGTSLAYVAPIFAKSVPELTGYIALRGLVNGGILTSSYDILSMSVPQSQQGIAFGLGQSANSLGNGLGPTIGGTLGSSLGLKWVFAFTAGMYLLSAWLVFKVLPKRSPADNY